MNAPLICLGQQPCGFFPKRFLAAKVSTARRLQAEIGGEIVLFYHDSDHDPRETRTTLRNRRTGKALALNFSFENRLQRKFSPLYAKRVPAGWREKTGRQLPAYVSRHMVDAFMGVSAQNVADFCLEMYGRTGLLEGVRVVRWGTPQSAERPATCPSSS